MLPQLHKRTCKWTITWTSEWLHTRTQTLEVRRWNLQGAAFNITHFESRITRLLYTAINTTEHGHVSHCLVFTKSPKVFNTTSWRCPPRQSRHCCHLPGTLPMTQCSVSCVTFVISWRIAFLRLLMSGRVWVKAWAFKYPHKKHWQP